MLQSNTSNLSVSVLKSAAVKICSDPEPFVKNIYTFPTGAIYKRLSFLATSCHLPAIVSVRIDNYSEHDNGLRYFSVQVAVTIPEALRLKFSNENENELPLPLHHLQFSCIYYFKCHFLRMGKSYTLEMKVLNKHPGNFFLSGWKRLYLYWILNAIGFHLQLTDPNVTVFVMLKNHLLML